jgi:DNA-binding transcriptional LysR family regulator
VRRAGRAGQYFLVRRLMPGGYAGGMELRHLRYFVAVADELSFTKAAAKLHVAQPALSRQVRQLEEELGTQLFDRNRRAVTLTTAGSAFLAEARSLLERAAQAMETARNGAAPAALNVGYSYGLFHSFVPRVVEKLRHTFPELAVNLFDLAAIEQADGLVKGKLDGLVKGKLDAGFIGFAYEADSARLPKEKIGSCEFIVALPKNHRSARKPCVSLCDLADDIFFTISNESYPGASRAVARACEKAGFRPKTLQYAERGFTQLNLVSANCGVAIVPEPLRALPHAGVIFRPLAEPISEDLFLAFGKNISPSIKSALLKSSLQS